MATKKAKGKKGKGERSTKRMSETEFQKEVSELLEDVPPPMNEVYEAAERFREHDPELAFLIEDLGTVANELYEYANEMYGDRGE